MTFPRSETRDGIRIDWDLPLEMDDGVVLRADVFAPLEGGRHGVILSYGPYGKWMHFADGSPHQWERMSSEHPETIKGSTNEFQSWELVDPEKWVPDGFVCVRVDSRGMGRSPGFLEPWSPRETRDLYECIEWAGVQSWSNGKVGLNGISYYAMNQWQVAAEQPPHLAAMCVWEGAADLYRELAYHGGILCTFADLWYRGRVLDRQHGLGSRGSRSRFTGDWVSGPETVTDEVLGSTRTDFGQDLRDHPLIDDYWKARIPDLSKVEVPLLSAGNWGGGGLHLRGNIEGFVGAASREKWLELHGLEHWTQFYTDYGVNLQKRFFGHFLNGEDTNWEGQPPVLLHVRKPGDRFELRHENEWPLARTQWTKLYLDPNGLRLSDTAPEEHGTASYDPMESGLTFLSLPLEHETEITGPLACKLFISSETEDADIFVVLRLFSPDMSEVTFKGANEPRTPLAHGWLRASHRRLGAGSETYRPKHDHETREPLVPGEVYELDIEIWPTCIVAPAGFRIGLSVQGKDYMSQGAKPQPVEQPGRAATSGVVFTGVGPFRHNSSSDRNPKVFGGRVSLHMGGDRAAHVLVPVIPSSE